jgi:UDP-N-acetylmuramoyl-tripeptide--D-alanyl-D-alanine ligase
MPGALYVALKGERFDGHDFVKEALSRGASAAMVDGAWAEAAGEGMRGAPLLAVPDTLAALQSLARGHRRRTGALIVAVTGSVGKTSVKELAADMLAGETTTARTRGNWNNAVGLALSVLGMASDARVGVFEIGTNHPGEIAALCAVLEPSWGVVTNVGPAHIEFFGTERAIAEEKAALLDALPADGLAVLNADGGQVDVLRARARCRAVTVSLDRDADYRAREWDAAARSFLVETRGAGERVRLTAPAPGRHVVSNALLAVAVARERGVSWEKVRDALRGFGGLPMRWESVEIEGVRMINDAYNANPASMRAALATFASEAAPGRKWLVLGGMLELGGETARAHEELGRLAAGGPWAGLIAVGDLTKDLAAGARANGMPADRVAACADAEAAARQLNEWAAAGDAVLIKGSRGFHLEDVVDIYRRRRSAGYG